MEPFMHIGVVTIMTPHDPNIADTDYDRADAIYERVTQSVINDGECVYNTAGIGDTFEMPTIYKTRIVVSKDVVENPHLFNHQYFGAKTSKMTMVDFSKMCGEHVALVMSKAGFSQVICKTVEQISPRFKDIDCCAIRSEGETPEQYVEWIITKTLRP